MSAHSEHNHSDELNLFGFWLYIMTDCILFATIFACFIVLRGQHYLFEDIKAMFSMPYVLQETLILLTSSFTYGLAFVFAQRNKQSTTLLLLIITFLLGAAFIHLEINEFVHLYREGFSWSGDAFLSSFFTLVGTHGLHVTAGLIWMFVVIIRLIFTGIDSKMMSKIACLGLFWHFLDIVWIFVFSIVYLMGGLVG